MEAKKIAEFKQFTSRPWWYTIRGLVMILVGGGVAILCVVAPNVYMLGTSLSWIPVVSLMIILVGVFRCIDAFIALTPQGFLLNMQGGIMDIVVGFLVLFSIKGELDNLNLLIIAYMIIQGIYRNIVLSVAKTPNPISNRITGIISILLGVLIWIDLPTISNPWFLALSLSIDVCFRGWALIVLASVLKRESNNNE